MHVVTQAGTPRDAKVGHVDRQPTPADRADINKDSPWFLRQYYPGVTVYLDIDRSVHRDSGYPGWVQLSNGDIFMVDYINDDAPLAQIRGYRISRSDYVLFPTSGYSSTGFLAFVHLSKPL